MAVLGVIMLEKDTIDRVADILTPESFYVEGHQVVYRAALSLYRKSQPIDTLTVFEELMKSGENKHIEGPYYLTKLTESVTSSAGVEQYAMIIQQKFMRRELIRISGEILGDAYDETIDTFDLMDEAEQKVMGVGTAHINGSMITMDSALVRTFNKISEWRQADTTLTGVPSGYQKLDRATRGWQPGDLIIIAARPSVGKTAFALNLVRNAALSTVKPIPVAVWSLEMDVIQLILRMLAAESDIILYKIQTGRLSDEDMMQLQGQGAGMLSKAKIFFDESPSVNITSFRAKARRLKKKYNIGMIVVDYLQLMSGEGKGNREQEVSNISRELKKLAKELAIPIIALSQLSRAVESRTGTKAKPQLSDLRESGAIEQDADMVMFLWGPSEEEVKQGTVPSDMRYIRIAKSRNGVLITEEFDFKKEIQLFNAIDEITGTAPDRAGSWKPVTLNLNTETTYQEEEEFPF